MLSDGDDVGAGDFGDGDAAVGLVGRVEVDVVGSDTCGDGDLQVLGFGEALGGEVTGVESRNKRTMLAAILISTAACSVLLLLLLCCFTQGIARE